MYAAALHAILLLNGAAEGDLAAGVLKDLNARRKAAGLPAVTLDAKLSAACRAHARYLAKNYDPGLGGNFNPHTEDPDKPGYTKEGARAARQSEISFSTGDPRGVQHALGGLFGTFFHRIGLIRPDLRRIGLGYVVSGRDCWVVLDDRGGRGPRAPASGKPVLYPPPKAKAVPPEFAGPEFPNPIPPEGKGKKQGYPVTVTFPDGARLSSASARIEQDGREVAAYVSSPLKPAYRPEFQHNTLCLIPKAPLRRNTTYRVTAEAVVNGKPWRQTWDFTTGE